MIVVGFLVGTPTFLTRHSKYLSRVKSERRGMGSAETGGKYGVTQSWYLDYLFSTTRTVLILTGKDL